MNLAVTYEMDYLKKKLFLSYQHLKTYKIEISENSRQ